MPGSTTLHLPAGTLDGGAGTIFLRNAGEVNGELFVSALDSRFPSTVHLTRATPLAGSANTRPATAVGQPPTHPRARVGKLAPVPVD